MINHENNMYIALAGCENTVSQEKSEETFSPKIVLIPPPQKLLLIFQVIQLPEIQNAATPNYILEADTIYVLPDIQIFLYF